MGSVCCFVFLFLIVWEEKNREKKNKDNKDSKLIAFFCLLLAQGLCPLSSPFLFGFVLPLPIVCIVSCETLCVSHSGIGGLIPPLVDDCFM